MVTSRSKRRQPDDPSDDALWKYRDVATYVGVSAETIRRWVKDDYDSIPHRRIAGCVRFIPAEVRAWVEKRPRRPAA